VAKSIINITINKAKKNIYEKKLTAMDKIMNKKGKIF